MCCEDRDHTVCVVRIKIIDLVVRGKYMLYVIKIDTLWCVLFG